MRQLDTCRTRWWDGSTEEGSLSNVRKCEKNYTVVGLSYTAGPEKLVQTKAPQEPSCNHKQ
ncbi:hypothetical protein Taro_047807 [Colocasia esculenta]|uniref:Uncharacterized protein n=1 Tax=Colocasia esculenta TaxID=4460 RepID=A0A843X5U3_COLES|nr:hypothetical protein [Colocasia esculenta]